MNIDYRITKISLHELLPNVLNSVNSVYILAKLRRMFICICFLETALFYRYISTFCVVWSIITTGLVK